MKQKRVVMPLFKTEPISKTKARLRCSESDAIRNLEAAATRLVKEARWYPYRSKINELREPLLQILMARRAAWSPNAELTDHR